MSNDSSVTQMQKAFIDALNKKLQDQFSKQLDGTFQTMQVPDGLYYGLQYGPNNYYNKAALDQINQQAIYGSNDILTVGNSTFTGLYDGIMGNVVYAFSQSDAAALQQDSSNTDAQQQALIKSWETDTGGPIKQADIDKSFPATKLGYILNTVQEKWKDDPDSIPNSMRGFKEAYQTWMTDAQVSYQLLSKSSAAIAKLKAARADVKRVTAANGGLQVSASEYYAPFGPFPTQNKINGDLQSNSTVEVKFVLDNFSSTQSRFSVEGSVGFSIPIYDVASIGVKGSAKYTVDKYTSSQTKITSKIVYKGITFVQTPLINSRLSDDNLRGWYLPDQLSDAIRNNWKSGTNPPKTGFALKGDEYPVDEYFGPCKKFSMIKTWVLSQKPTISMQFCGGETSKIKTDFQQKAHVDVTLFGFLNVASVDQSYQITNVDDKSVSGCVTVEMGPTKILGTTGTEDLRAFVVGGVPSYPPNNT